MSESSPQETLSDVVARRIVLFRKRLDMTRDQLAARCAELGYPSLTSPALANIETGRRAPDGKRRRDITVDEAMVLAKALKVAPVLLLFPVGTEPSVPVLPQDPMDPWDAARWLTGEAYQGEDVAEHWAIPLYLFRTHDRLRNERLELMADQLFAPKDEEEQPKRTIKIDALRDKLKDVRAEMHRHGLTPPAAVDDLEGIDDRPRRYMTAREAEARIARGETVTDISHPHAPRVMKPGDPTRREKALHEGIAFTAQWHRDNPGVPDEEDSE